MPRMNPAVASGFCSDLTRLNSLDFREWLFRPGMLFQSGEKWWGDGGRRSGPHEGIDLCFYRTSSGEQRILPPGTLIPVIYDGEIISITEDFLGRTIFVRHDLPSEGTARFFTIYGHVSPHGGVSSGAAVNKGDAIAGIAERKGGPAGLLPHLHLSAAFIAGDMPPGMLDWKLLNEPDKVSLIDPLALIGCGPGSPD